MKFIMLACISCLLIACAAEKTTPVVVAPAVETANEILEPQPDSAPVDPNTDALADTEWAPNDTLPDDGERTVELGVEGEYQEDLEVAGRKKPEPAKVYRCKVPKDCYGTPAPRSPGEFQCVKRECVYIIKKLGGTGEDVVHIF